MNEYNMNEDQNMPDEFWRRAFDEAAETPPPRVWDAIEGQLDEPGDGRVVPLWANSLSRPVVWSMGLAAAVALLLVGVWLTRTEPAKQPAVARVQPAETELRPGHTATHNGAETAVTLPPESEKLPKGSISLNGLETVAAALDFNSEHTAQKRTVQPEQITQESAVMLRGSVMSNAWAGPATHPVASFAANTIPNPSLPESELAALAEPGQLASRGIRLSEMRPIQRVIWLKPVETDNLTQPAEEQVRVAAKTKWASVSIMPGVFNPDVAVAVPTYANALAYSSNAKMGNGSTVNSRASVAVSIQVNTGVQLTERWSVESGVGYLVGRSTVESPGAQPVYNFAQSGITANNTPVAVGNLYTDLLRSQTGKAARNRTTGAANDLLISNTNQYANLNSSSYSSRQTVSNNYAYVQVPMQVGYELRPRKRLTLAVLGGLITNIFVKNTVDDELVIKAGDGVYKPVALAASMGARFRYRSSERWSASLAGVYQPALTPGTRPNSPVHTQPTTSGVTVGVDYHF